MRARVVNTIQSHLLTEAQAAKAQDRNREHQQRHIAIFTSNDSIFLPRYSGVPPHHQPAMKTASTTKTSIPYSPAPTPPMMISPSWMLNRGTKTAQSGEESCIELTAPQDASVVTWRTMRN